MGSCIRYRRQFGVDECTCYVYANRRLFRVDGGTLEHGTGRGIILWVGVDILMEEERDSLLAYLHTQIHT